MTAAAHGQRIPARAQNDIRYGLLLGAPVSGVVADGVLVDGVLRGVADGVASGRIEGVVDGVVVVLERSPQPDRKPTDTAAVRAMAINDRDRTCIR